MWELDCKESWALKNWCFWNVMLEKTLESPLDCKEIQPVNHKWNQTDAEAETPILWPPDAKNWLTGKDLMLGKIDGRRRRGWQRMRWLDGNAASVNMSSSNLRDWWWTGKLGTLQSTGSQRVGHDWTTELNCIKSTGQFMGVLTSLNIIREIVKRPHLEWGRDLALNYIWSFGYHGGLDILFTELRLCM